MRKTLYIAAFLVLALAALLVSWWIGLSEDGRTAQSSPINPAITLADTQEDALAQLPVVLGPEATPTATATLEPTITPTPTVSPTPGATTIPGDNALVNGGFEEGWTDLPPNPGNQVNQNPNGWTLSWVEVGQPLYDDPDTKAEGICECVHKLDWQLPPNEQPGGPDALILDGVTNYKIFHGGTSFGSELRQTVSLPPGSSWRLTVPVQLHRGNVPDPWEAESGAWVLLSDTDARGGWANIEVMGDHRWFDHIVEFEAPASGQVVVLVRVKAKAAKDFFLDALRLEPASNPRGELAPGRGRIFWGAADYPDQVDYWGWLAEQPEK